MVKKLLYKEFYLSVPWGNWGWLVLGCAMLLVPHYAFVMAFGFVFYGFANIVSNMAKTNQDVAFSLALPVPKWGIVASRALIVVVAECGMLTLAVPFALIRFWLYSRDNVAGMNANLAFFGLVLVMYALFNLIYLPGSFRKLDALIWPLFGGTMIALLVGSILTALPAVLPALSIINDRGLGNLSAQAAVFLVGLLVYIGVSLMAYRRATANFAAVDL